MPKIELDLDNDLYVNDDNRLSVKIAEGSTLQIKGDGLYAFAPDGDDGSSGDGYPGTYNGDAIRLGYSNPFDDSKTPHRVVGGNIIHHVFTSDDSKGENLQNFRPEIDCVLIGDMFRVKNENDTYTYYLVTSTSWAEDPTSGNYISDVVELGTW